MEILDSIFVGDMQLMHAEGNELWQQQVSKTWHDWSERAMKVRFKQKAKWCKTEYDFKPPIKFVVHKLGEFYGAFALYRVRDTGFYKGHRAISATAAPMFAEPGSEEYWEDASLIMKRLLGGPLLAFHVDNPGVYVSYLTFPEGHEEQQHQWRMADYNRLRQKISKLGGIRTMHELRNGSRYMTGMYRA